MTSTFTKNQINFIKESKGKYNSPKEFYTAYNNKFKNSQKTGKQLIDKVRYLFGTMQGYYATSVSTTTVVNNKEVNYFLKHGIKDLYKTEIKDYLKVLFNVKYTNSELDDILTSLGSTYKSGSNYPSVRKKAVAYSEKEIAWIKGHKGKFYSLKEMYSSYVAVFGNIRSKKILTEKIRAMYSLMKNYYKVSVK